ncbi:MAG: DUF6036 family nucleotidyltransferase [Chthoniobacterales bacterium]
MDADAIGAAFQALSDELGRRHTNGEICLLGGTAMVLAFRTRQTTKDVDAIFEPATVIRDSAAIVAEIMALPKDWLNDAAKAFLSERHQVQLYDLPQFDHLRVVAPVPEYLLAMKVLASRIGSPGEADDRADIRFLLRHLALRTVDEAVAVAVRYYPVERLPVRAQYLLEELLKEQS